MIESAVTIQDIRGIAFVASYVPRHCGIATFTHDLADAVTRQARKHQPVIVTALNDHAEGYAYPDRVKFEIRQDQQVDYSRAADYLNFSRINVVSLQHEYGIYGGEWGANVLTLLRDLHRPVVVTCHTVLQQPEQAPKEIFHEIAARADKVVVMSKKAAVFVEEIYGVNSEKIALIPHGIHDVPFIDPNYYKDKFGVEGRRVILTFGLLHPYKGIEYMIEALPRIVEKHPRTTYLVLGATHPAVIREEGEAYRLGLQRRVRELGLEDHVLFHPQFVELDELLEYIGAADIFVTPYIKKDQITSGVLAYAMGAGKAVVSTPFWYAEELLAEERGRLVPTEDSDALGNEILSLLDDEVALNAMRKRAYKYCRNMVWSATARSYLQLFDEVTSHVAKTVLIASATRRPIAATNLPNPKIDHLLRLSDDTGPAHFAHHTVPVWSHGYAIEDAAAVLVVSAKYNVIFNDKDAEHLAEKCMALLQTLIGDGADVASGLDYARHRTGCADETSLAQALWALGYVVYRGPAILSEPAIDLFHLLLANTSTTLPRAAGYSLLGAANYLLRFPGASEVKRFLAAQAKHLVSYCKEPKWIELWKDPDYALAAQAISVAARILNDDKLRKRSRELVAEIREITRDGTVFTSVDPDAGEEERPMSAAVFIEALNAVFYDTRDRELIPPIRAAADWFLGANRIATPIYDFSTGGCYDALTASGVNRNQGTEATLYCLLAFLTLHRLAATDEGPEDQGASA